MKRSGEGIGEAMRETIKIFFISLISISILFTTILVVGDNNLMSTIELNKAKGFMSQEMEGGWRFESVALDDGGFVQIRRPNLSGGFDGKDVILDAFSDEEKKYLGGRNVEMITSIREFMEANNVIYMRKDGVNFFIERRAGIMKKRQIYLDCPYKEAYNLPRKLRGLSGSLNFKHLSGSWWYSG